MKTILNNTSVEFRNPWNIITLTEQDGYYNQYGAYISASGWKCAEVDLTNLEWESIKVTVVIRGGSVVAAVALMQTSGGDDITFGSSGTSIITIEKTFKKSDYPNASSLRLSTTNSSVFVGSIVVKYV